MSSITSNDIKKGRVAQVTRKNDALGVPKDCWSVVTSDGMKEQVPAVNSGVNGNSQPSSGLRSKRNPPKVATVAFYLTKKAAWERSGVLNGVIADSAAKAAARLNKMVGQEIEININIMGGMGIGCVEGVNNIAGTELDDAGNDIGTGAAIQDSPGLAIWARVGNQCGSAYGARCTSRVSV